MGVGIRGGRERASACVLLECGKGLGAVRGAGPRSPREGCSSPLLGLLFGIPELIFPQKQS